MQYERMLESIKKKEQKELKERRKRENERIKHEERMSNVAQVWLRDILPDWHNR